MNFLAHLYFAERTPESMIGNMLADFIKGRAFQELSPPLQKAVLKHRQLDAYTDQHPVVKASASRLKEKWGRYAPVLVDVFYDHFLASQWGKFHQHTLPEYVDDLYSHYRRIKLELPEQFTIPMEKMMESGRLLSYQTVPGIEESLLRMNQRMKKNANLHLAVTELKEHYDQLNEDFQHFFPDAVEYMRGIRE
jgi:acyl carrier protein phosphodiesterase